MIDSIGLVNMNGRVYDPFIGRFMSADPVTEDTFAMQLLNHYSYVGNNPLSYTDMTGFGIFRQILAVVVAVAIAILLPELLGTYLAEVLNFAAIGSSQFIGIAALTFGVAGGAAGAISTGSLSGALLGAAGGFVFGAIAPGLGATFGNWLGNPTIGSAIGKGFAGGLQNVITGGKFSSGFLSAGFSELANPITPAIGKGGLVVSSIAGGAGSILGGGKFANGAVTGAFAYLASSAAESMGRRSSEAGDGYDSRRTADSQEPSNLFGGELYDIADAQVTINRATHEAAVAREVQQWRSRGFIVTPGVTFFDPKSGLIVIADYVVSFRVGDPLSFFILPKPEPILVRDVKTGRGGLTDNQYHVYPHMMSGGVVVPVGPNAFLAGFEIGYPVSVGEMYVGGELPPFTNQ
jgi:RHS repeat-associated protein